MNHLQGTKITQLVPAVAISGGGTSTATIDTNGYDYVTIVVNLAASATPSMTALPVISLLTSDTDVTSNYATVVADVGLIASSARDYVYHIDKRAKKRYFKLSITRVAAGTDGAGPAAANAILSKAVLSPASTSDMVGSSNDTVTIG